jgi:hypothetical protein
MFFVTIMKRLFLLTLAVLAILAVACNNEQPSTPVINLSQNTIDAWYDTEIYIIDVYANCEWKATSDSDWVVIQKGATWQGDGVVKFEIQKNESSEPRTAQITVEVVGYTDIFETITISQSVLSDDYFEICYTSTDNKVVEPYLPTAFDAEIVSNTYENGIGTILFDNPVTKVGDEAFCDCSTLKSITLPDSVTELGGWSFFGCIYLEEITLSNRLKSIGDAAFSSCSTLLSITIPQSVENVGDSAFYGCSGMSGYYGKFASEDNRCLIIDNTLRHFAPKGLDSYTIPNGITAIAHDAFYESLRLKTVTIPQSVTSIEDCAFYYCENLKSVYCRPTTPPALGEGVFDNYDDGVDKPIGCKIYVPTKSVEVYKSAKNWSRYKTYIYGEE